jgi:D-alanyl-lipoteichoic acid acyltransferase DltB (MBOAT superfamily)
MMISLFLSFILVGLWHGPTIGYLLFGLLHGVAVVAVAPYEKLLRRVLSERQMELYLTNPGARFLRVAICFHFLCATIALFERSPEQALALMPLP